MARNDPLETRVEKMAQWAAGIEEQITDLQSKITMGDHSLADAISAELGDLFNQYSDISSAIRDAELRLVEIAHELAEIDDALDVISAVVMLSICAELDENGKPIYSNDKMRSNELTVRVEHNEEYKKMIAQRRDLERESAIIKAQIADMERGLSEYRNRNRALVARLNNLTARLSQ